LLAGLGYSFAPNRRPLVETAVWGLLVIASFIGWGAALERVLFKKATVDLGLLGAWGAAVVCIIGGFLASMSLLRRPILIGLVLVGVALAGVAIVRARGTRKIAVLVRFARREPIFAFVGLLAFGFVGLHYLAEVANWHTDPQNDDAAYLGFVKKLLDTGSFAEPFSIHRATALGAQTLFIALVAPRATLAQAHTFDRGICLVLTVLLVVSYTTSRRPPLLFRLSAVAFLLIVPSVALDTASYLSGVVFFFALFRTLSFLERRAVSPWAAAVPTALLGATACALRDSYWIAPITILTFSYAALLWKKRDRWMEAVIAASLFVIALAPWLFMHDRSSGILNPVLELQTSGRTWVKEIVVAFTVAMEGLPIRTLPVLFVALVLVRDTGARKPIWASVAGFIASFLIVFGSQRNDQWVLARQVFGFTMAIALVAILESGVQVRRRPIALGRTTVAAAIGLSAVLIELLEARQNLAGNYQRMLGNIDALALSRSTLSANTLLYSRVQNAIPPGERVAAMLDDTGYLDYARNPIVSFDLPGYASPAPGQPFFRGSEALAAYLRSLSIHWVAFVLPERSRYQYRRDYWITQMTDERDILRPFAPYIIDTIDNLTDLTREHPVVFEERGIVVVKLD
jgi:hypothetical protein